MDNRKFDDLAKRIGGTRRRFLKHAIGLGGAAALGSVAIDDADAARRGYSGPSAGAPNAGWGYQYKGCNLWCVTADSRPWVEERLTHCIDTDLRGCSYCGQWATSICW